MIRLANERDFDDIVRLNAAVQELHAQNVPWAFRLPSDGLETKEWFLGLWRNPSARFWVAEDSGLVVGYLFAQEVQKDGNWMRPEIRYLMLEHIAVDRAFRRRGLGHALMDEFTAEAKARGIQLTEVGCWSFNEEAARFYQRHGFMPIRQQMGKVVSGASGL